MPFERDFFELQLNFARHLSEKRQKPYELCLFEYTSLYVRLLGYSDEVPPSVTDPRWIDVIENLPVGQSDQVDFVFSAYRAYEHTRDCSAQPRSPFGCFSYTYHESRDEFELHFAANDPHGNLGKERASARRAELDAMFADMKSVALPASRVLIRSWLLNIEPFTRLLPHTLVESAHPWQVDLAQDQSMWGQFVDRFGRLKLPLAMRLLQNVEQQDHSNVNEYFPLPVLVAEVPTAELWLS